MNSYKIIKADIQKNKEIIKNLLKKNVKDASTKRYEWNYEKSEYGNAQCWLVKSNNSESFIGSAALFPRRIYLDSEPIYVAIAGDFAINKEHRAFGPALRLQKEIQKSIKKNKFKFIYGTPNKLSRKLFFRIGYQEIGKYKRYVKILKTEYVPKEYLPKSLRFKIPSKIIDLIIKIISYENRYKKKSEYYIENLKYFDKRFDSFWKKVLNQYNIIGERTSNFLNWRYIKSPSQNYKIFCISNKKKEISGYIVYYFNDNICHIVDILYEKSEDILKTLLAEFIINVKTKNIGSIVVRYLGDSFLEDKLKKFNFFENKKEDANVMIYGDFLSSKSDLLNGNNWHFLTGDSDV